MIGTGESGFELVSGLVDPGGASPAVDQVPRIVPTGFFGRKMAQNGQISAVPIRPKTEWTTADHSSRPEGRLVQVCRRLRAQF